MHPEAGAKDDAAIVPVEMGEKPQLLILIVLPPMYSPPYLRTFYSVHDLFKGRVNDFGNAQL